MCVCTQALILSHLWLLPQKPIEEGKRTVQDRVDSLKKACVAKCAGDYQPQEFRKGTCNNLSNLSFINQDTCSKAVIHFHLFPVCAKEFWHCTCMYSCLV